MELTELLAKLDGIRTDHAAILAARAEEIKALAAKVESGNGTQAELKSQIEAMVRRIDETQAALNRPAPREAAPEHKSIGQLFTEHAEVQNFGKIWKKSTVGIEINDRPLMERKTTITSGTVGSSTPGILVPERVGGIYRAPARRLRVRDIIPFGSTQNNSVEYVRDNVFTNAASPLSEGSTKGESALTFTIASAPVRTIAHWIPASRQVLEDWSVLQAYINTRLLEGLADIEDHELLRGDNTDQHLNGLITQATATVGTYAAASDNRIDQVAAAMMELEAANYMPDALVLHPADWRRMCKLKDEIGGANTGQYLLGGPASTSEKRIWDLPLVTTTAMIAGSYLLGQFAGSVQGFDRMVSNVSVSTEHASYFIQNLVAIRVEERITLACFLPAAFRYGSFS
jgi:HK97 family phage major capsid protein